MINRHRTRRNGSAGHAPMECAECGVDADGRAEGWRGYRTDDPDLHEPSDLAWFCALCAEREFGPVKRLTP